MIEFNRNPENYFLEVEQSQPSIRPVSCSVSASHPTRYCKGGSLFSCGDVQRYRLGTNCYLIPLNASRYLVYSYHLDRASKNHS